MVKINKEVFNQIINKYQLNITINDYIIEALTHSSYAKYLHD